MADWAELDTTGNLTASEGAFISDGGDFILRAEGDIRLTASRVSAQQGQAGLVAPGATSSWTAS